MLSTNEAKVLEATSAAIGSYGMIPTLQEVANATGLSLGGVRKIMLRLEYHGYIRRKYHGHRALVVLKRPDQEKTAA